MVSKSIPDQIFDEFLESLRKSSLFNEACISRLKKILETDKGISKESIISALGSQAEK